MGDSFDKMRKLAKAFKNKSDNTCEQENDDANILKPTADIVSEGENDNIQEEDTEPDDNCNNTEDISNQDENSLIVESEEDKNKDANLETTIDDNIENQEVLENKILYEDEMSNKQLEETNEKFFVENNIKENNESEQKNADVNIKNNDFQTKTHTSKNIGEFIYCPECGNLCDKNADFCTTCGKDFVETSENKDATSIKKEAKSDTKECPYCGKNIRLEAKKCRYCGKWLKEDQNTEETAKVENNKPIIYENTVQVEEIFRNDETNIENSNNDKEVITEFQLCRKCGNHCSLDAIFCNKCGKKLIPDEIKCSNCGKKLEEEDLFCPKCGTKVEKEENDKEETRSVIYSKDIIDRIEQRPSDIKQCPYCGKTVKSVAKKCRFCGHWFNEAKTNNDMQEQRKTKICPYCGEEILAVAKKCRFCSTMLNP